MKLAKVEGKQPFFSARQYMRVDRQIRRICEEKALDLPEGIQERPDYAGTGRNLNAVCLTR